MIDEELIKKSSENIGKEVLVLLIFFTYVFMLNNISCVDKIEMHCTKEGTSFD